MPDPRAGGRISERLYVYWAEHQGDHTIQGLVVWGFSRAAMKGSLSDVNLHLHLRLLYFTGPVLSCLEL